MALPPGPTEPAALQTARWILRPIPFLERCRRELGDAFSITFLGFERPMVMLSHPEAIRALYAERAHGLPPGRTVALLPVLGPRSVLLLEGDEHLARRRVMLPPFHGDRMRAYVPVVREVTERAIASWRSGDAVTLHPAMQAITLDVILRAVFGVRDDERLRALREALPGMLDDTASASLQFRFLLSRRTGRGDPLASVRAQVARIDELLLAEIAEHRTAGDDRGDVLSLLLAARFEDGAGLDDRELRDQLLTLLLAGHETTATALAWTFDLLLRHPEALARLTDEVRSGDDETYLRAVVAESLRLRPVVPLAGRRLSTDLEAGGVSLPAGTDVTPAIWLAHTRPDTFAEPYAFRPERFLDKAPPASAWIPFGGGVRRCLGAAFAEMEMRVVLQTVLRERVLQAAGTKAERVTRRNITFSPRHGTRVVVAA